MSIHKIMVGYEYSPQVTYQKSTAIVGKAIYANNHHRSYWISNGNMPTHLLKLSEKYSTDDIICMI